MVVEEIVVDDFDSQRFEGIDDLGRVQIGQRAFTDQDGGLVSDLGPGFHDEFINTVSPGFEEMAQTPCPSSRHPFFSRNPNPITALDDEDSLIHEFDHISIQSPNDTLRFPVQISEYHSGLFLASVQCDGDRRRVLEEQPWHFDKFLMVFTHPDVSPTPTPESVRYVPFWIQAHRIPFGRKSPQLAQFIADEIGDLIEIFPLSLMENFGPYLRLRVLLDITKPLRRGMTIRFRGITDPKWISFQYKNLPNFCYLCSFVDHTYNKCPKYLLRCDNFPVPPILEYNDSLRASSSSQHKRNPFEISNSIPFEEFFPRIRTRNDDQGLQQAVDQFLHVDPPTSSPVSHPAQASVTFTQPAISTPPPAMETSIPPPIMTYSVTTHVAKGKAIALSPTSLPSHIRGGKGVVINEPRPTLSTAISPRTRRTFVRQSAQVGDFVRSMLKRARAVISDDDVVPTMSDDKPMAGAATRPRREK
uniref:Zinc knuckle CX2CX4HX4C domain-containing protein n=1 Tax=Cannabis sativa TaxID=3483 RepID=A0A803P9U7_CANSA